MAYADQLVINLTGLGLELHLIRKVLPFAASAHPEMLTKWGEAVFGRGDYSLDAPLQVVFLSFSHQNIHDVARNCVFHEHNPRRGIFAFRREFGVRYGLSFGCHALD
jgi:hypothetical protein